MRQADERFYIRACSGFTGFAPKSSTLDSLLSFSQEVQEKIGRDKWYEWGSEQVTSSYIVANSKDSVILPYSHYPYHESGMDCSHAYLLHFIGEQRFKGGLYLRLSRCVIKELLS